MSDSSPPIAISRQGTFIAASFIVALLALALGFSNHRNIEELQRVAINLEDSIQTLHRASQKDARESAERLAALEAAVEESADEAAPE